MMCTGLEPLAAAIIAYWCSTVALLMCLVSRAVGDNFALFCGVYIFWREASLPRYPTNRCEAAPRPKLVTGGRHFVHVMHTMHIVSFVDRLGMYEACILQIEVRPQHNAFPNPNLLTSYLYLEGRPQGYSIAS